MLKEPIKITLYDENDEEIRTEECRLVPWGMLKRALAIDRTNTEATLDDMGQFIIDLFKGKITPDELDKNVPVDDVVSAFRMAIGTGEKNIPNA